MPALNYDQKRWMRISPLGMRLSELVGRDHDYHSIYASPEAGARSSPDEGHRRRQLSCTTDAAGIRRAVVLSVAYSFSNPNKQAVPNEYAHAEKLTSAQVSKTSSVAVLQRQLI
jgi:hypothetical protein